MLFPAYIRKNKDGTHKATFPDFDDSFSGIRNRNYLSHAFKHAVEAALRMRKLPPCEPSRPQDWLGDRRFQGGYWTLIDINFGYASPVDAPSQAYRSLAHY